VEQSKDGVMREPVAPTRASKEWKRAECAVPRAPAGEYAPLVLLHPVVKSLRCHSVLPLPIPDHGTPAVRSEGGVVQVPSKDSARSV
jgi:hypothetical protein